MSTRLPKDVQQQIKGCVYRLADDNNYLQMGRIENGLFLDSLLASEDVGGVLRHYMPAEKVRTYVKDAILNRYSKDRRPLARDVEHEIRLVFDSGSTEIEYKKPVSLHRLDSGDLLVVARGSCLKWETAIRRMLEFMAAAPGLRDGDTDVRKLLVLFGTAPHMNRADMELLARGLALVGISVTMYDPSTRAT